ncbi:MAG TPA: glycosyltransferase family 4 protein [Candidatus Acidoferrales bacterium]|nr:glycosyltransferase family 4 protein [Candidatus Acidoferrales bacterium]
MNQPRILIALPIAHPELPSFDQVLDGMFPCSGSIGSSIRLAGFLAEAGLRPYLSSSVENRCSRFHCINHTSVRASQFDLLILSQTHWDGATLTFGNEALPRTILWLQNQTSWAFVRGFLSKGGYRVVCPSSYHSNIYRAVPRWPEKLVVVYNAICPVFAPATGESKMRLLFVGAVTPSKGFMELMQVWSYLIQKGANLQLAIAGSIGLHTDFRARVGPLGVADLGFESDHILPWLKTLPERYQPQFLGALSPLDLRKEISDSWAVVVNPSWDSPETFCVAAVEAQACDRTVFSVAAGGLKETVYPGSFRSLATNKGIAALGDRILEGLSNTEAVRRNGRLAGQFVRSKFAPQLICDSWLKLISGQGNALTPSKNWSSIRDVIKDVLRWTGTGIFLRG